jgi:peptidoglycan/xylan/chitin deacetylase (PgdA/CDA1 family)
MVGPARDQSALDAERERRRAERARQRQDPRGPPRVRRRRRRARAAAALGAVAALAVVAFVIVRAGGADPAPKGAVEDTGQRKARPAVGPIVSGAAARRTVVPILMYHVIATPPAGTPYGDLWVAPTAFRAQVHALANAGYRGVTLTQAFAAWRRGAPLPKRPVVISFDDGYDSQSRAAAPVLRRLGWPGVLNLAVENAGPRGISLPGLRRLVGHGWEIDSHTVSHPDLTTLEPSALRDELVRSRAWIRRRLGVDAAFFCYPAGRFDATVVAAVRAAGYRGATTTLPGVATRRDDPYLLPRVRLTGAYGADSLLALVKSARAGNSTPRRLRPPTTDEPADVDRR